jgi:hypothetical protein
VCVAIGVAAGAGTVGVARGGVAVARAGAGTFAIGREIGPGFIVAAATAALFFVSGLLPSATSHHCNQIDLAIAMCARRPHRVGQDSCLAVSEARRW